VVPVWVGLDVVRVQSVQTALHWITTENRWRRLTLALLSSLRQPDPLLTIPGRR
jgi:hypothetical protein